VESEAKRGGDGLDGALVDRVVRPPAAALAVDDSYLGHSLQMVCDGRLAQTEWLNQVAGAGLAVFGVEQHRQQTQPGRVGEHLEPPGQVGGLADVEPAGRDRLAAGLGRLVEQRERARRGHAPILPDESTAKLRPGYANFAIDQPPLKLILFHKPGQGGSLNHLGVEVPTTDDVDATQRRLAERGLASVDERDTTCCYAKQDKFWVEGTPNDERREIYTVLPDAGAELEGQTATSGCARCTDDAASDADAGWCA
jgi:hypothetical protein